MRRQNQVVSLRIEQQSHSFSRLMTHPWMTQMCTKPPPRCKTSTRHATRQYFGLFPNKISHRFPCDDSTCLTRIYEQGRSERKPLQIIDKIHDVSETSHITFHYERSTKYLLMLMPSEYRRSEKPRILILSITLSRTLRWKPIFRNEFSSISHARKNTAPAQNKWAADQLSKLILELRNQCIPYPILHR